LSDLDDLLKRAGKGDQTAEQEIFRFLLLRFGLFARHWVEDARAAEDIVQEACVTVLEKYKAETYSVGFEAWAYGVLRMTIRRHYQQAAAEKSRFVRTTAHERIQQVKPESDLVALQKRLRHCLSKIVKTNRRYARVLNLTYQGYKSDEICPKLGISRNSFYVTLYRARSLLRDCLESGEV
jgi:RNA polymerase sigma factor (sigma-70 family)